MRREPEVAVGDHVVLKFADCCVNGELAGVVAAVGAWWSDYPDGYEGPMIDVTFEGGARLYLETAGQVFAEISGVD